MNTILSEYGTLILSLLSVLALFIVYGVVLDNDMIQFIYYSVSPFSEYNVDLDSEEVVLGTYDYGVISDQFYSVGNFARTDIRKAPHFKVGSSSTTVIPVVDEDVKTVNFDDAMLKKYFIDDYGIKKYNMDESDVTLDDILIVEYSPKMYTEVAPDGTPYDSRVQYEWGYCLDEYGNKIRSTASDVRTVGWLVGGTSEDDVVVTIDEEDAEFALSEVRDSLGYLLIPTVRYARTLYRNAVSYGGHGGDSAIADSRHENPEGIYEAVKDLDDFVYKQDDSVRYKVVYRTDVNGMKAQHIALFRNTLRPPYKRYPDLDPVVASPSEATPSEP